MKRAIVVGSGAGGATVARELAGHFDVTVLEAGGGFRPYPTAISCLEWLKSTRLLFSERQIQMFFPSMRVRRAEDMVIVTGSGLGGSTTISTGTAVRRDAGLKALGLDLDEEFDEIAREIPITTEHSKKWLPATRRLFEICGEMRLDPQPSPKMVDPAACRLCGRCVLGCGHGAKWDSRRYLDDARAAGARVLTGCPVERIEIRKGVVRGVHARFGLMRRFFAADVVVLAAGAIGTAAILDRTGIATEPRLTVDPVLCIATEWPDALQCSEVPMPFTVDRPGYMIAPYFDLLSFLFNRDWRYPARHTLVLMVELADESAGTALGDKVDKKLGETDRRKLDEALALAREILDRLGAKTSVLGTVNAGHPAGTVPLVSRNVRPPGLPDNLWVADGSLLPRAPGAPQILTIVALAKRVAKTILAAERASPAEIAAL